MCRCAILVSIYRLCNQLHINILCTESIEGAFMISKNSGYVYIEDF